MIPTEHFNKPSLAKVAERCFNASVKFNPEGKEGGVLRFQTNSMSFYQKMNIRQNSIEGNLLRREQIELERERNQHLRVIKWDFIELRHDMGKYNDHFRSKIKRRREEKAKRREQRKKERDLEAKMLMEGSDDYPTLRSLTPNAPVKESGTHVARSRSVMGLASAMSFGVRIGPEMMDELGLSGVEVPKLDSSWGKVSRTVLNLHRAWDREKTKRGDTKPRRKVRGTIPETPLLEAEPRVKSPERSRTATKKNHQSYYQSCLAKPFSYEEFADRKISCKENEVMWMRNLRDPHPRTFKRFIASAEEDSMVKRQFSERNLEKAKLCRKEMPRSLLSGTNVKERITRMKFTSSKMLEERAELDRKAEEDRIQTDKFIRRHKYLDKNISVADVMRETPSYLRYRHVTPKEEEITLDLNS